MINTDVFKTTVEQDLNAITKRKVDILILQRQNETLCQDNNKLIKEFTEEITDRELSLMENLSKSGERKIETPAGWCAYRTMPDKWEYDDGKIIDWCKLNRYGYYHVDEILDKLKLKKAIQDEIVKAPREGLTITPQEPKFNYKLSGGL